MQSTRRLSCTACRRRKVRCVRLDERSNDPCRPCVALDLICDTPLPKKRGLLAKTMSDLRPSSSRTGTSPEETAHVNTDIASNFDADLLFTQSFDLAGGGDAVDMEQFASTVNPSANSDASQQTSLLTDFSVASSFNMNYSERQGGLDNIMSRERILYLVAMFFEFVWPLQPILHESSFTSRLQAQNDKTDPLFLSLVASVLAVSLVHVPRDFMPYSSTENIADIADQCYKLSRTSSLHLYDPPTVTLVSVRFLDAVYNFMIGNKGAWVASLAESTRLAIFLELHRESSYTFLSRSQILVDADTNSPNRLADQAPLVPYFDQLRHLCNQTFALDLAEIDVGLHQDMDDDYITATEIRPPSDGYTSKLVGFTTSCSLFRLVRDTILLRRHLDQFHSASNLLDTLAQLRSIHDRLDDLFRNLNPVLKVERSSPLLLSTEVSNPDFPPVLRYTPLNSFTTLPSATADSYTQEEGIVHQVIKANLHTTRAVARMLLINCREKVKTSSGQPGELRRKAVDAILEPAGIGRDSMHANISDLLHALRRIPIQAVSANSHSLVNKIRTVAVTLLENVTFQKRPDDGFSAGSPDDSPESMLFTFLALLTRIEDFCPVIPSAG